MAKSVGKMKIELVGDSTDFNIELRKAEANAKASNGRIRNEFLKTGISADKMNNSIKSAGVSLLALGAGAALGVAAAAGVLKDFGAEMSTVKAVTGATETQFAALTAEARRLGATTKFSATQAAQGITFLARAGFTADEALMSVEGTLKLAQAGNLDLGRAADIASNVLGGFNLNASQTSRVVDVLAKAANSANVTVESLGESLKFAAPTAAALGLGLEETVALIGKLGDSGLSGGLSGRGFQSFATAFVSKKDEIKEIIGDFNVADEGLIKLIDRLVKAGITTEQVIDIFRAENLDVFTVLANASQDAAKGLTPLLDKLLAARGTADQVAKVMGENLNGAILTAQSAMQELILTFGDLGVTDGLIATFSVLTGLFRLAADNADILGVAIVALAFRSFIPFAVSAVPKAFGALATLSASLLTTATTATTAGAAMNAALGPFTLAVAAAAAAFVYFGRATVTLDEALRDSAQTLADFKKAQTEITTDTDALKSANERLAAAIRDSGQAAIDAATLEVDAIRTRIANNESLKESYRVLFAAQIAGAEAALRAEERAFARDFSGVRKSRKEARTGFAEGGEEALLLRQQEALIKKREDILKKAQSGEELSKADLAFIEKSRQIEEDRIALLELIATRDELEKGISVTTITPQSPIGATSSGPTEEELKNKEEELKKQEELLRALNDEYALKMYIAMGEEELAEAMQDRLDMEELAQKLVEAGYANGDIDEARIEAERRILDLKREQEATDLRKLNLEERQKKEKEEKEDLEKRKEEFRDVFTDAVEGAIRDGNVGDAIKSVFANRVAAGMRDALNDLADLIFDLFSDAFKNINAGSSGGGGLGGLLVSLGSAVVGSFSGSSTNAGAGANIAGTGAIGKSTPHSGVSQTIINIAGDASEKTIAIMDQKLSEHRRALPGAIDARVSDRLKRGAY